MAGFEKRRVEFDIARALAIFAVILQHLSQYYMRYGLKSPTPQWCSNIVQTVSFIHIATFMLVSGILLASSKRYVHSVSDYVKFEVNKFNRLMLPFFSISMLHLLIKMISPSNSISTGAAEWKDSFIAPQSGIAGHLWFLYCLMSVFLIWPLLSRWAKGRNSLGLLIFLVVIAIIPIPWPVNTHGSSLFGLKRLVWYLPIFTLGYLYGYNHIKLGRHIYTGALIAGLIFCCSLAIHFLQQGPENLWWQIVFKAIRMTGFVSAAFCLLWSSQIIAKSTAKMITCLATAGRFSYDIYLLHVALVGHPLIFLLAKLKLAPTLTFLMFSVCAIIMMIAPIGISLLIRRLPILAFIMLGVPVTKRNRGRKMLNKKVG